jgi:hypothetical protein
VVDLQKKIVFWSHGAELITANLLHEVLAGRVRDGLFRDAIATHAKPVARYVRSGLRSRFSRASKIATNLKRVNRAKRA